MTSQCFTGYFIPLPVIPFQVIPLPVIPLPVTPFPVTPFAVIPPSSHQQSVTSPVPNGDFISLLSRTVEELAEQESIIKDYPCPDLYYFHLHLHYHLVVFSGTFKGKRV